MNQKATIFCTRLAIVNFIVLTTLGLVLRYMHISGLDWINYQFLLHAHSHFAFSGWMFFAIALLIIQLIGPNNRDSAFKWVLILAQLSAYGMLISFYLQGYKAVSITFSTLFVVVTYRFTYLVFKSNALKSKLNPLSYKLIKAALIYLCISSVGPLMLGPLMAIGFKNTPYYPDAIYVYLHFQMNGFMLLAAWGLFASTLPGLVLPKPSKLWAVLFIYSAIPLYFIFTLWSSPGITLQLLSAIGAAGNLVGWFGLCIVQSKTFRQFSALGKAALIATTLKIIFQVFICIPAIGKWTFSNHDLIIGYIHLLTLGIITPLILDQIIRRRLLKPMLFNTGIYIAATVVYLSFLFLQPFAAYFGIIIPGYQLSLFGICSLFLITGVVFLAGVKSDTIISKGDKHHFLAD